MPALKAVSLLALNRRVGLQVYQWLVEIGDAPAGVILPANPDEFGREAGSDAQRRGIPVITWSPTVAARPEAVLGQTGATLFISIHFPERVPDAWLSAFSRGCVNLHPGFLPWGKGWHTPTWAILDGTPFGVTLHYMAHEVDAGGIIAQQEVVIEPWDTAHSVYGRAIEAELRLFRETWHRLREGHAEAVPQASSHGSYHRRADLDDAVRRLDLDASVPVRTVLNQLRALTTDRWSEAAWFQENGRRYAVRVEIQPVQE